MLWLWDEDAVLIFDPASVVVKRLGSFAVPHTSGASGVVTDARLTAYAGHTGFVARTDANQPLPHTDPILGISGNNVTWNWPTATRYSGLKAVYGIK